MHVGARIKQLRAARGMTQRDLAEPRYTPAYVCIIEGGKRRPSRDALEHFAGRLGVEVDELLTGRPPGLPVQLELDLQDARRAVSAGRFDEADAAYEKIARQARRYQLARVHARALCGRGLCAERRGRLQGAVEHYEEAERILEDDSPVARVEPLAGKARCLQMLGDIRFAIHLLESMLGVLARDHLDEPGALARLHASLVAAYFEVGLYEKAAHSADQALRLAPTVADPEQVANMHINAARVLLHQGRIPDAEQSLRRAEDLYRTLDLKDELGVAHLARGIVLGKNGDPEGAGEEFEVAIDFFEQARSPIDTARALNELGRVRRVQGRLEDSRKLLERSIDLLRDGDVAELGLAYRELALTYVDEEPPVAHKHFIEAIGLYERAGEAVELGISYRMLGDLLEEQGDAAGAVEAFRNGIVAVEENLKL